MELRPTKLVDFKGKNEIKANLEVYIKSCQLQHKPFDHTLLYGLPGTGKTTLAHIVANELNRRIRVVQGSSIQRNVDIINLALTLNEFDILFIDEIHGINPLCVELLYSIMEDFVIDISLGKDFNSKITRLKIPHFTLIGATTLLGKIPQPLEDRFGIVFNLTSYDLSSLIEILTASAKRLKIDLTLKELQMIASNSKGIPRNANRLLYRIKDFRISHSNFTVARILRRLQILDHGLDYDDLSYLNAVSKIKRPVGLKTLSQIINVDPYTIETKIEPFLVAKSYIEKSIQGRIITKKGNAFVQKYVDVK
jgi:Holliday junction DNA helicase RuvB